MCAVEGNRQIVAGLRPLIAPQLDRLLAGEQAYALGLNHVMRPAGVLCGRRIRRGAVYRAEFASEKRRGLTVTFMIIFTIGYYVVFTFLPTYFIETLHLTKTNAFVSSTLASLVALISRPAAGRAVGPRRQGADAERGRRRLASHHPHAE